MRVAVIGHVEWVEFAHVDHVPMAGEVVHASATFSEPAGGGAVAAVWLARLAGEATLFTALGDDELGARAHARLEQLGVRVRSATRPQPTRHAVTFIDPAGERTITTLGPRLEPCGADDLGWSTLQGADAVYLTAGDVAALAAARDARVVVASPRARTVLGAGIPIDALVLSAADPGERAAAAAITPAPALLVQTRGAAGGSYSAVGAQGSWPAAPLPGPVADSYGCGDAFAATLAYGLGSGRSVDDALALAARCGAQCLTLHGPYGAPGRMESR